MPGFKATVIGENFNFIVDDEPQPLEFSRTLFVDAADVAAAEALAIAMVREALLSQSLLDDDSEQLISVNEIAPVDKTAYEAMAGEFVWYFPDNDAMFDDED